MEVVERKEIKQKERGDGGAMKKMGGGFKNFFKKRGKVFILVGMFALLIVTGYLNWAFNPNSAPAGAGTQNQNLFAMLRNTRADERARDIVIYESMVGNDKYSAESQRSAETMLLELRANVAFETQAEGLILAEKYADVIVNRSNGFVNVLLKRDANIDRVQAVKIMSILQGVQPNLDIDNVFISIME